MKIIPYIIAIVFLFGACKKTEEKGTPEAAIDSNQKKMGDTNTAYNTANQPAQGANVSPDFKFAVNAADGGMAEVKLSELAEKNGTDKTVREFAKTMIRDHTKAADELKALAQKKNITLPEKLSDKNQSTYNDLSQKTGADFDKAYMDKMLSDHKSVVSDFQDEAKSGKDADLQKWAQKTLPTLQHHQKMAQNIYDKVSSGKPTAKQSF